MATIEFPGNRVCDWTSFHEVSKEVFGFPSFYGMNMDAWIDCLTYLDDGMSRFDLSVDEDLTIVVHESEQLRTSAPEVFRAIGESVKLINQRSIEAGERARVNLTYV